MNKLFAFTFLLLSLSCVSHQEEKMTFKTDIDKNKTAFIDSSNFKFFALQEFELKEWNSSRIINELKSMPQKKLIEYFQNDRVKEKGIDPKRFNYFSIQQNSADEKRITIIEQDGQCCSNMHLLVYNSDHRLISDIIVAETGGDGMWSYNQYGKFENDSTFISTRVDFEETDFDSIENKTQIDSVITNYSFTKNQPFEKFSEQKFSKTME